MPHTPGPWVAVRSFRTEKANEHGTTSGLGVYATTLKDADGHDFDIAKKTRFGIHGRTIQEADDNARLFAAAPETAAERDRLKAVNAYLLATLERIADHANAGWNVAALASEEPTIRQIALGAVLTVKAGGP